jgi:hypothetical protein
MDGIISTGKKNPTSGNSGTLAQEIARGYAPTMKKLGLLPTVQTQGLKVCNGKGKTEFMSLALLPTPTVTDVSGGAATVTSRYVTRKSGKVFSAKLQDLAKSGLLPTPKCQDERHALRDRNKSNLGEQMSEWNYQTTGQYSQLNPLFVEQMMGFPEHWTLLPFLSGEKKQSRDTGTP